MTFLAQIVAWLVSDIRNIIIVVLVVALGGAIGYGTLQQWKLLAKEKRVSELTLEVNTLKLNNKNLESTVTLLKNSNEACNNYLGKVFTIKKEAAKINERIEKMGGSTDELSLHNDLVNNWNN